MRHCQRGEGMTLPCRARRFGGCLQGVHAPGGLCSPLRGVVEKSFRVAVQVVGAVVMAVLMTVVMAVVVVVAVTAVVD